MTTRPVTDRLPPSIPLNRTAEPGKVRVGEHPGGLNETGTDAGSVLNAELAGSAPPQADGIVRWERMSASAADVGVGREVIWADGWRVIMHVEVRSGPLHGPDSERQQPTNPMSAALFSGSPQQ